MQNGYRKELHVGSGCRDARNVGISGFDRILPRHYRKGVIEWVLKRQCRRFCGWLLQSYWQLSKQTQSSLFRYWFAVGRAGCDGACHHWNEFHSTVCGVYCRLDFLVLAITRPFVKKKLAVQKTETNSRALIGKVAKVVQPIDNLLSQGRVIVEDMDSRSARSENGEAHRSRGRSPDQGDPGRKADCRKNLLGFAPAE